MLILASREQDLSDHYRDDAVTSAGENTPDSDTVETTRQALVPPLITTCIAQPRSLTPAPIIQNTILQTTVAFYQRPLQAPARSLPAVTPISSAHHPISSAHHPISATESSHTPVQGVNPQRLAYDFTPQQPPPDPYTTGMPLGPYVPHYYCPIHAQPQFHVQYQQQQQQVQQASFPNDAE